MHELDQAFSHLTQCGWSMQHLGTDGLNCPWNCILIKGGEFYNGNAIDPLSAIQAALTADPYIPVEREIVLDHNETVNIDFVLANLRKNVPSPFKNRL